MKRILFPLMILMLSTACGKSKQLPDPTLTSSTKTQGETTVVQDATSVDGTVEPTSEATTEAATTSTVAGKKWSLDLGGTSADLTARSEKEIEVLIANNRTASLKLDESKSTETLKVFKTEYQGVLTDASQTSYPSKTVIMLELDLTANKSSLNLKDYIQKFQSPTLSLFNEINGTATF